ncbi:MAG: hypothetical protein ACUVUC_06490 [Thermoguttaceae bacterium]
MADRLPIVRHCLVATLAWSVVALAAGCPSALFTAVYLIRGNDVPAECKALRDKRVAVVCRPVATLQFRNARADQDLAEQVGNLLRKHVPKIKVIDHRKVYQWLDENTWDEFTEVGRALGAEMVVGIELDQFEVHKSQTLLQGRANTTVKVYDCKTGQVVFEKRLPPTVYPPNREVPAWERHEGQFRREFLRVLADQIARHFYDHDPYADFAMDSKSID